MGLYSVYDRGINDAFQRRLGIKDDVGLNLMPELAPVVDMDRQEELQYFLGWRTWHVAFGFAALAANAMKLQFQNPPSSGAIMLLENITVSSSIAGDGFVIGFPGIVNNAAFTTPVVVHAIQDGRMRQTVVGALPGGAALISTQQGASPFGFTGANGHTYPLLAATNYTVPWRPYTLIPGTTILMAFVGANAQQVINLGWRERAINDQEGGF